MLPIGIYLVLGSAYECASMLSHNFGRLMLPTMLGSSLILLAGATPILWNLSGSPYPENCSLGPFGLTLLSAVLVQLGCFVFQFSKFQPDNGTFLRAILSGWVSSYFGMCFAFAVAIRLIGTENWGLFLIVGIIVVTKTADAGAYFSGKVAGRTKLCPTVSPNKTVEGLLGGGLIACCASALYFKWLGPNVFDATPGTTTWTGVILMGTCLTIAGLCGDLLESVFKRETGEKDSGKTLPGLGGMWDVTDSLLPGFAVGYLVLQTNLI